MKVGELIEKLAELDPSTYVMVVGFEGFGCDALDTILPVHIGPLDPSSHGPDFGMVGTHEGKNIKGATFHAVLLGNKMTMPA